MSFFGEEPNIEIQNSALPLIRESLAKYYGEEYRNSSENLKKVVDEIKKRTEKATDKIARSAKSCGIKFTIPIWIIFKELNKKTLGQYCENNNSIEIHINVAIEEIFRKGEQFKIESVLSHEIGHYLHNIYLEDFEDFNRKVNHLYFELKDVLKDLEEMNDVFEKLKPKEEIRQVVAERLKIIAEHSLKNQTSVMDVIDSFNRFEDSASDLNIKLSPIIDIINLYKKNLENKSAYFDEKYKKYITQSIEQQFSSATEVYRNALSNARDFLKYSSEFIQEIDDSAIPSKYKTIIKDKVILPFKDRANELIRTINRIMNNLKFLKEEKNIIKIINYKFSSDYSEFVATLFQAYHLKRTCSFGNFKQAMEYSNEGYPKLKEMSRFLYSSKPGILKERLIFFINPVENIKIEKFSKFRKKLKRDMNKIASRAEKMNSKEIENLHYAFKMFNEISD